jgi:quercetin dioxygenase-like cupin family protein
MIIGIALAAQSQPEQSLFENDRVHITRHEMQPIDRLPHNRKYDVMTVQLGQGETTFKPSGKLAQTKLTRIGDVHYFPAGTQATLTSAEKSVVPFVELQFMRSQGKYSPLDVPRTHYCNPGSQKACVTEQYLFCTDRFCVETVTLDPGAVSTQHTHDADHIVIPTSNFRWREESPGQPPANFDFKPGEVKYVRAGVTHTLSNVGNTTATMVVVQFK